MEKRNRQLEHGQQWSKQEACFASANSGVARCQSQHQYLFLRISSMSEAYYTGK